MDPIEKSKAELKQEKLVLSKRPTGYSNELVWPGDHSLKKYAQKHFLEAVDKVNEEVSALFRAKYDEREKIGRGGILNANDVYQDILEAGRKHELPSELLAEISELMIRKIRFGSLSTSSLERLTCDEAD